MVRISSENGALESMELIEIPTWLGIKHLPCALTYQSPVYAQLASRERRCLSSLVVVEKRVVSLRIT